MRFRPTPLNPNPTQRSAAFLPPPSHAMTISEVSRLTLEYLATIRIAYLAGYRIAWVIPGREGQVSDAKSLWSLETQVVPVEEIIPARTAQYDLDPYVLVKGRPHAEPPLGTRVPVQATVAMTIGTREAVGATVAPTGLGETARWLPDPSSYTGGLWRPSVAPVGLDSAILWTAAESNAPEIDPEYTYIKRLDWITTSAMVIEGSTYFRLDGMPLYSSGTPQPPITLFFVVSVVPPSKYWGSLLRAMEPDGSATLDESNLDLRLMPDGNLHPFTWGWQRSLPFVGTGHTLSLFGLSLDVATNSMVLFTIDKHLQVAEMSLPAAHSATSQFALGRTAEAVFDVSVLDILFYRGPMTVDRITDIANELDAAYGISVNAAQGSI